MINLDNTAFKTRVGGLVGGIGFLKALGYKKNVSDKYFVFATYVFTHASQEDGSMLVLSVEVRDMELLALAQQKLAAVLS